MKLCWKCREYLEKKYGSNFYMIPSNHCHHDEPEEKPSLKCWCEYSPEERNNWNVSVKDKEGIPVRVWSIKYCPHCGRKL